jgi:hypothetical protein
MYIVYFLLKEDSLDFQTAISVNIGIAKKYGKYYEK